MYDSIADSRLVPFSFIQELYFFDTTMSKIDGFSRSQSPSFDCL